MKRQRVIRKCANCGEHKKHQGRGLCIACWSNAQRHGWLKRYPRTAPTITPREPAGDRPHDLFLEDLAVMGFDSRKPRRPQFRRIAVEMGMQAESLERRWQRAQRRLEAA